MALKDFQEYVASQGGGGAEQYVDPTTGKIKTEKTGGAISKTPTSTTTEKTSWLGNAIQQTNNAYSNTADYYKNKANEKTGNTGFDFGAANNLGTALKPVNTINPALSITGNTGDSAWQQSKDAVSKDVATNTGKDYIPYTEQAQNKVNTPVTPAPTEPTVTAPTPAVTTPTVTTPTVNTTPTTPTTPTVTPPTPTPPTNVVGGQAGSGNAPTPTTWKSPTLSGANDMSDYINELYAKQRDSQLAALESGYNQQMAALDAAAGNIPQQYYEAGRQQAGQNALDTKAMNERLMASGLNTGAAGQAALAQNAVNQGNMARIRQAEADALAEVEQQRASASVAYQDAIREAILNNDTQKALALYQEAQRVDESMVDTALKQAELDATEYEYQREAQMQAQERADKKAAQELEALQQRAATMASIGDFSLYEYLGYSPEQIAALGNAYIAANTPKSSGGGGGGGGTPTPTPTPTPITSVNRDNVGAVVTQLQASGESKDTINGVINAAVEQGLISPQDAIWLRNG